MLGLYLRQDSDIYLSFLPLAHIMETLIMAVLVSRGIRIGFYNGDAKKLLEDAQILKPTCMCGVPRIFQRIYDIITSLIYFPEEIKKENVNNNILIDVINLFDKYFFSQNYINFIFKEIKH